MVIANGTIIDGSGQDRYLGDMYLEGGKIIKIVKKEQSGKADTTEEVIDATGKYVLPGLIDMHSTQMSPWQAFQAWKITWLRASPPFLWDIAAWEWPLSTAFTSMRS